MHVSTTKHRLAWALSLLFAALCAGSAPALAQPSATEEAKQRAINLYNQAQTQYDLGNFERAIELFKEAYQSAPYPEFLFNIAQSYRQMGECKQALFFYKRYSTLQDGKAPNQKVVDENIRELSETCTANERIKNKEPLGALPPDGEEDTGADGGTAPDRERVADAGNTGSGIEDSPDSTGVAIAVETRRQILAATLGLGPAFLNSGDLEISGALFSLGLGVGYPLPSFGKISLILGGLVTYTPVPWDNEGVSGTASMTGVLVNVSTRYWAMDKLTVGADVGMGGMFLGGLKMGSVFLQPGDNATGALGMFNLRVGLGVEYFLSRSLAVSVAPLVISYSPAKEGLRMGIDAFTRIEFLAGVGYRM